MPIFTNPSPEGIYDDGDFRTAQRAGPELPEAPFENDGDADTLLWRSDWLQDADAWVKQQAGTQHPDRPGEYLLEETGMSPEEGNLLKWQRLYGPVPPTRTRPGSIVYGFQYGFATYEADNPQPGVSRAPVLKSMAIKEINLTVPARIEKSYHLLLRAGDIDRVTLANKDALLDLGGNLFVNHGSNYLVINPGPFFVITSAPWIVAQDATLLPWKGPIFERTTIRIKGPTLAFWGTKVPLPQS